MRTPGLPVLALSLACFAAATASADNGLGQAAPEDVGMSAERLDRLTAMSQRYVDEGKLAGVVTMVARGRPDRPLRNGRPARCRRCDRACQGRPVPNLLDEQAYHRGGGDDVVRGRQVPSLGPGIKVRPRTQRPRGAWRGRRNHAGRGDHDDAPPADAYHGAVLWLQPAGPGRPALS